MCWPCINIIGSRCDSVVCMSVLNMIFVMVFHTIIRNRILQLALEFSESKFRYDQCLYWCDFNVNFTDIKKYFSSVDLPTIEMEKEKSINPIKLE